jgi:2-haloacid dehalogenase
MTGPAARVDTVVFDIGQVLIEWDPRHLYRKLIPEAAAMERFLAEICTPAWNLEQDRGRPWEEGVAALVALFPDHAPLIRAFRERWHEMVPGEVPGTMALVEALRAAGVPLYAITNFAADTFAEAARRFPVLREGFRDVVVSGLEGLVKPDPAIFRLLLARNGGIDAVRCLFVDDSERNVRGAEAVGMRAHHFRDAATLEAELRTLGLLPEG